MNYVCAALCAVALLLGYLYHDADRELSDTKARLETAKAVNDANAKAAERLQRSIENTDRALAGWNEDRTTLAGIRSATQQAIKEAMNDEIFKAWATGVVPDDAWRLLHATPDSRKNSSGTAGPSVQPAAGLPGNAASKKRQ